MNYYARKALISLPAVLSPPARLAILSGEFLPPSPVRLFLPRGDLGLVGSVFPRFRAGLCKSPPPWTWVTGELLYTKMGSPINILCPPLGVTGLFNILLPSIEALRGVLGVAVGVGEEAEEVLLLNPSPEKSLEPNLLVRL